MQFLFIFNCQVRCNNLIRSRPCENVELLWSPEDKANIISRYGSSNMYCGEIGDICNSTMRTTQCIDPMATLYYFETTVQQLGKGESIAIGLNKNESESTSCELPGCRDGSIGYHGHDGKIYHNGPDSILSCEPYSTGDTVGCCLKRAKNGDITYQICFFTLNGVRIEPTRCLDDGNYYPMIDTISVGVEEDTSLEPTEYVSNSIGKFAIYTTINFF